MPLWVLFVAVQLVDVAWALFVLAGVERVRIVPGITASNPLDLEFIPYTHSLPATAVWAALGFAAWRMAGRGAGALVVALAVASHWFLDLLMHRPDLPLWDDSWKVGLGLWNFPLLALALEVISVGAGLAIWFGDEAAAPSGARRRRVLVFVAALVLLQAAASAGPAPTTPTAMALTGLGFYGVLALLASRAER